VLNEQRNFIYGQRDAILENTNLKERILAAAEEMIEGIVDRTAGTVSLQQAQSAAAADAIEELFGLRMEEDTLKGIADRGRFISAYISLIKNNLDEKSEKTGEETFNAFLRFHYLRQIDSRWQDHLETMEALREAVHLRSYAQKNPLLEYKLEGFDIFDAMLSEIKYSIAKLAVRVQISEKPNVPVHKPVHQKQVSAQHSAVQLFGSPQSSASAQNAPAAQIRRPVQKVGRNDPCPCGSGKKYKHCCGA
jgi:preprotein translocase subunit SecA